MINGFSSGNGMAVIRHVAPLCYYVVILRRDSHSSAARLLRGFHGSNALFKQNRPLCSAPNNVEMCQKSFRCFRRFKDVGSRNGQFMPATLYTNNIYCNYTDDDYVFVISLLLWYWFALLFHLVVINWTRQVHHIVPQVILFTSLYSQLLKIFCLLYLHNQSCGYGTPENASTGKGKYRPQGWKSQVWKRKVQVAKLENASTLH